MSGWSFYRLFKDIVDIHNKEDKFVNWLIGKDLLPSKKTCECGYPMALISQKDASWGYFVCDRTYKHEDAMPRMVSMFEKTLFEKIQLDPLSFIILSLCYAKGFTTQQAVEEVSHKFNPPSKIERFYVYCNDAISEAMLCYQEANSRVGGDGIVVELFQAKFEKRNYSNGRIKEGMCILCMIEKDSMSFITEIYEEGKQDIQTLFQLMQCHVMPGSTVITKRFTEYAAVDQLSSYNFSTDLSLFSGCCHELQQSFEKNGQHCEINGEIVMNHIFRLRCKYKGLHTVDGLMKALVKTHSLNVNR